MTKDHRGPRSRVTGVTVKFGRNIRGNTCASAVSVNESKSYMIDNMANDGVSTLSSAADLIKIESKYSKNFIHGPCGMTMKHSYWNDEFLAVKTGAQSSLSSLCWLGEKKKDKFLIADPHFVLFIYHVRILFFCWSVSYTQVVLFQSVFISKNIPRLYIVQQEKKNSQSTSYHYWGKNIFYW